MNKTKKIDSFINYCVACINSTPDILNNNFSKWIYGQLITVNMPNSEKEISIGSELFNTWIERFKSTNNINVFVDKKWTYFCQFTNDPYHRLTGNYMTRIDPIKIYLSVDSSHVLVTVDLIFEFMASRNITHCSKVAYHCRNDEIVIRVSTKEEALQLSNFIKNNPYIQEGIYDPIPFSFTQDKIGYALDGTLSYNTTLCQYLQDYFLQKIQRNDLNNASYEDFYLYMQNCERYFNSYEGIKKIQKIHHIYPFSAEKILNYKQITELIVLSINPDNNMQQYYEHYDKYNNTLIKQQELNKIARLEHSLIEEEEVLDQMIFTQIAQFGIRALQIIQGWYQNNNSGMISSQLIDCVLQRKGTSLNEYFYNKYQEISTKINSLMQASIKTLNKYGEEQVYLAINNSFANKYMYFTNNDNARNNLINNVKPTEILNVIKYSLMQYGYDLSQLSQDQIIANFIYHIQALTKLDKTQSVPNKK